MGRARGARKERARSIRQVVELQWGRAPRSAETGRLAAGRTRAVALQWGRAPRSAETTRRSSMLMAQLEASMGPRSEERGNSVEAVGHRQRLRASMGPRSEERGNAVARPAEQPCDAGFNGAALRGARKPHGDRRSWLAAARFNGAALRGARKQIDSRRNPRCVGALQWGRAPRSAETHRSQLAQASEAGASMGPRSEERGNR